MKLYSGPLSLFTAKVRIALAEKGLDYEKISVGWSRKDRYLPHHPDVVALNPNRQVPVLVDGDIVVYDSTVILEYLEDRTPEPRLYPGDAAGRARCRQLEAFADETLFPHIWDLIEEVFYPAAETERDAGRLSSARSELEGHFRELDEQLAGGAYLCGDFSVADIGVFIMASTAATLGVAPDEGLRNLAGWLARTTARPAVGAELAALRSAAAQAMSA